MWGHVSAKGHFQPSCYLGPSNWELVDPHSSIANILQCAHLNTFLKRTHCIVSIENIGRSLSLPIKYRTWPRGDICSGRLSCFYLSVCGLDMFRVELVQFQQPNCTALYLEPLQSLNAVKMFADPAVSLTSAHITRSVITTLQSAYFLLIVYITIETAFARFTQSGKDFRQLLNSWVILTSLLHTMLDAEACSSDHREIIYVNIWCRVPLSISGIDPPLLEAVRLQKIDNHPE